MPHATQSTPNLKHPVRYNINPVTTLLQDICPFIPPHKQADMFLLLGKKGAKTFQVCCLNASVALDFYGKKALRSLYDYISLLLCLCPPVMKPCLPDIQLLYRRIHTLKHHVLKSHSNLSKSFHLRQVG